MALPPNYTLAQAPTFDMGQVLGGTALTTTQQTPDIYAMNFKGVTVVLNVTAAGTGSVTLTIQGKDSASGAYFPLVTGAAIVANGTSVYTIYPGIAVAAASATGASVSGILPANFRIVVTAGNANPTAYTVGAVLTT